MNTNTRDKYNYFFNLRTVTEIKSRYRELMMKWHPDRHPEADEKQKREFTRITQEINEAYHAALASAHGSTEKGDDGRDHTYKYNQAEEQAIMDKIEELIKLHMEGVEIWLIGYWIWVIGETKPYKDLLGRNGAGLSWHSKRQAWYWKPYEGKAWHSNASLGSLAYKYGATQFKDDEAKSGNNGKNGKNGKKEQRQQRRERAQLG